MTRSFLMLFLLHFFILTLKSQKNNGFGLVVDGGVSYFFNDPSLNRRLDNTRFAGINYQLINKNKTIIFNPGLGLQLNQYSSEIKENQFARVSQFVFTLNLDMLLKLNKHMLLRVGLFGARLVSSDIEIAQRNQSNRGYYFYSNSDIDKNYHPANLQAGITTGLSFPFKAFRRDHKFNLKFVQFASSLVKEDYLLSQSLVGKETKVLSVKARPSMFIVSLDINLKRIKKKKQEE